MSQPIQHSVIGVEGGELIQVNQRTFSKRKPVPQYCPVRVTLVVIGELGPCCGFRA